MGCSTNEHGSRLLPGWAWVLLSVCVLSVSSIACGSGTRWAGGHDSGNLLQGLKPQSSRGVTCVSCLNDGVVSPDGGFWKSESAALLRTTGAFVQYDLGTAKPIVGSWLQGDNNDNYVIEVSEDGRTFRTLWTAGPVPRPGLQARVETRLRGKARYVRVTANGGDGSYSLTEVQLVSRLPKSLPIGVDVTAGIPKAVQVRSKILAFGVALIGLLVLAYRRAPRWWLALVALVPMLVAWDLFQALTDAWPQDQRQVSLVRGTIAVVAAVALLRELWAPPRFPAHRGVVIGVLGLCGIVGVLSFYNLGNPQFRDRALGDATYVHHLDLRQYYPTAKYFPEVGYRSMYVADVAAYLEDHPEENLEGLASRPLRNLEDLQMSSIGAEARHIRQAPRQFSPERWREYKADARYFREAMGDRAYFSTFYDMGGNATPVWIGLAHVMFNQIAASESAFSRTALLDVLLIAGAFAAIGFVFGPRTAFLCMVIFGANDFIMYDSNWGGATLRHDWMAYLAFAACALKKERWLLAGALLALTTGVRAFPALALVGLCFPATWWYIDYVRARRRLPSRKALWAAHRPLFLVAASAASFGAVLFIASSVMLGFDAWGDWYVKVSQLSADPHGNHISLRSLIAGWETDQPLVLADRLPLFLLAVAFYVGLVFAACRNQSYEQSAILGLILTPVLFYPANYYIHLIWLLPLVMSEHRRGTETPFDRAHTWVGVLLLGLCAAQYFTVLEVDRGLHFYMATVLLFATITFLLVTLVRRNAADLVLAQVGSASESEPRGPRVPSPPTPSRRPPRNERRPLQGASDTPALERDKPPNSGSGHQAAQ